MASVLCAAGLVSASCGGTGNDAASGDGQVSGKMNTVNTAKVHRGGTVTYTITYPISNWNVLSSGGATYSVIDVSGVIAPSAFVVQPDGSVARNQHLIEGAEKTASSPQTVEYKIRPDARWSDGKPITAKDFVYTWHALDPKYCPKCQASNTAGYNRIKSITGSDNGKTVQVVFDRPYVDWKALFSPFLPAHVAKTYGDTQTPQGLATSFNKGLSKNVPKWSAGPFRIKKFTSDGSVIMVRNKEWYGPKPHLDKLVFRLITDVAQQPTSLANHEVDVIYPTPQVDIVDQVDELPGVKYQVEPAFQSHYLRVNFNVEALQSRALRKAIFQAVDVPQFVHKTIGQFDDSAKPLKGNVFVKGSPGYEDVVSELGYGAGKVGKAKATLKHAGYTGVGKTLTGPDGDKVPELRIIVPAGSKLNNSEAQLVKAAAADLGLTLRIETVANQVDAIDKGNWAFSLGTVTKSPFTATDSIAYYMSCPDKVTYCRFNLGKYGNPKVDKLLKTALSETTRDGAIHKLQKAEKLIAEDYAFLPLYQNRSFLAYDARLGNIRDNSLAFPTYNSQQWGWIEKP